MKFLVTSDLHLTDRPQDNYRFGLFKWLRDQAQKHNVKTIFLLGDITDRHDAHRAELVNRIVFELVALRNAGLDVHILKGNHDYVDPKNPFFDFIQYAGLNFYKEPEIVVKGGKTFLLLPHTRHPKNDWNFDLSDIEYIMMHHTFAGARASNGMPMDGLPPDFFDTKATIYSGDIHVPQQVGPVIYCGSPYHVRFGDSYEPRVILDNNGKRHDLHYPAPKKHTLEIRKPERLRVLPGLSRGDQVKVRLRLRRAEFYNWSELRRQCIEICDELGLVHDGRIEVIELKRKTLQKEKVSTSNNVDPLEVFYRYCEKEGLDKTVKEVGEWLVKERFGEHALLRVDPF